MENSVVGDGNPAAFTVGEGPLLDIKERFVSVFADAPLRKPAIRDAAATASTRHRLGEALEERC